MDKVETGAFDFLVAFNLYTQNYLLSCNCVILSTNKGGQINFMLFSLGSNKAFLVPDSCRATERNSISISTDITEDTIEYD